MRKDPDKISMCSGCGKGLFTLIVLRQGLFPVTGYTRRVIAYDTKANRFVKCANLKERRMHHSATVLKNKLYITGGRFITSGDVVEDSDNFDCFDPKTDSWTSQGALPYKLFDHGSLTLAHVAQTRAKS